jgi:hypothetical protein
MTQYQVRQIAKKIRNGNARVEGKTCDGSWWPEGEHFWIITDFDTQSTLHVPVDMRPTWGKYIRSNN